MNADNRKSIFEDLFRSNYEKLFRYAMYIIGNEELARDAVSDAFVKLWETSEFESDKSPESLIFIILRNRCFDMLRHINVKNDYAMRMSLIFDEIEEMSLEDGDERLHRVMELIDQLPPRTRLVMEQCYIQDKTYKEVAQLLNITPSGVKQHIIKGLAYIRKNFNKKSADGGAHSGNH